ncbi:MAG: hypothetical protein WAM94_09005 [Chromatiaceae bacterium]
MPGPRLLVDPPTVYDRSYGLWSTVQDRSALAADVHWRNGVTFEPLCGLGGSFYDDYCLETNPASKADNISTPVRGATPFVAFAQIDCSPVGYSQDQQRQRAADALTRSESYQVETAFWTGAAGGDASIVYPHLAANAAVLDTNVIPVTTLQCAATQVTGSALLDITEALGRIEAAFGACGNSQGTIHVPMVLGEQLFRANAVKAMGAQLVTQTGHLVALGTGYTGSGPDGTLTPNAVWIYMTGPVFGYRTAIEQFQFRETLDRTENTVRTIAERSYVLGFDCCCLYAVLVSVGGIVTGQPLGAF